MFNVHDYVHVHTHTHTPPITISESAPAATPEAHQPNHDLLGRLRDVYVDATTDTFTVRTVWLFQPLEKE